eukprot:7157074-Prymnesium_polylepis.1
MRRLALLVGLLTRGCLSRMCNRNDVIVEAEGERVWTMAGCTGLDLSCPNATREAPCNNSLVKGDLPALVLGLGETGQELTSIELRGNWLGPHGATLLSESFISLTSLASLGLASCRIGDYGVMALAKALLASPPPQLEKFDLSHNSVGDAGMRELSAVLEVDAMPKLAEADLSWNGVGPRGARYLGGALARNTGLQRLNLDWNGLMDRGARALGEALAENGGLRSLSLEHNAIKNEGARALAQGLRTNGALQALLLDSNGISRAVRAEVVTALESTPEEPTSVRDERRRADDASDDIEEISFDEEEEAPRAPPVDACVDHGRAPRARDSTRDRAAPAARAWPRTCARVAEPSGGCAPVPRVPRSVGLRRGQLPVGEHRLRHAGRARALRLAL